MLIGTVYPLLLEAFTCTQVGVGSPFFNRLAVPLSFLLLLVMGIGPLTPWQGSPKGQLWRRIRFPIAAGLSAGVLTSVFVSPVGWVVLSVAFGVYVVSGLAGLLL